MGSSQRTSASSTPPASSTGKILKMFPKIWSLVLMLVLLVSTSIVQGQPTVERAKRGIFGISRCNLGETGCMLGCIADGYGGGHCGKGFFDWPDCKCTGEFPTTTTNTEPTNKFEFTSTGLVDSWLSTGEFPTTTTNTEPT